MTIPYLWMSNQMDLTSAFHHPNEKTNQINYEMYHVNSKHRYTAYCIYSLENWVFRVKLTAEVHLTAAEIIWFRS